MIKNIFSIAISVILLVPVVGHANGPIDPRAAYASCQADVRTLNKNWTEINIKMMAAESESTKTGTVPSRILYPVKRSMFEYVDAKLREIEYYSKRPELSYRCPIVVAETTKYIRDGYENLIKDYPVAR